jgi:hypothetical protein
MYCVSVGVAMCNLLLVFCIVISAEIVYKLATPEIENGFMTVFSCNFLNLKVSLQPTSNPLKHEIHQNYI